MPFQIGGGHGQGVSEECGQASIPGKITNGIWCEWVPVSQSSQPHKLTGAHSYFLRVSDVFLQYKKHYISCIGVCSSGWSGKKWNFCCYLL